MESLNKDRPKGSPQYINKLNKIKILNSIRKHGQISRADLVKQTGISAPTVTRVVGNLIHDERLVKDVGIGISSGGRRPTLVEFAALDNFVIGIDLGTTHIDGVLTNLNAETIAETRVETHAEDGFDAIINRTANIISKLKKNSKVKDKNIFGVGMAVAGLINRVKNVVEFSPDFHWENVDIAKSLKTRCKLPIKFDNVTRVMALGELTYGIGHRASNFVVVNIGYGIGAGIIIDGQPLYGQYGMAGEFGHMIIDKNSIYKCECGNYGCLEALASGRAISFRFRNEIKNGSDSILKKQFAKNHNGLNAKIIADAARKGDQLSNLIFNEAIDNLGQAIASLINLTSPEVVLIGGGVSQAEDLILDRLRGYVNSKTLRAKSRKVQIIPVTFGMKAATKGAVALILNDILQLNYFSYD
jgi:glucokinase-like ROK family protein